MNMAQESRQALTLFGPGLKVKPMLAGRALRASKSQDIGLLFYLLCV
jgi:hypothetical protein